MYYKKLNIYNNTYLLVHDLAIFKTTRSVENSNSLSLEKKYVKVYHETE